MAWNTKRMRGQLFRVKGTGTCYGSGAKDMRTFSHAHSSYCAPRDNSRNTFTLTLKLLLEVC